MKRLKTYVLESLEDVSFDGMIDRFTKEFDFNERFGKSKDEVFKEPGLCALTTTEFVKFVNEAAFEKKCGYSVVKFDRQVGKSINNEPIFHHTAANWDSETIVDFTSGQFVGEVRFFKGSLEVWKIYLQDLIGAKIIDIKSFVKQSDFKDPDGLVS